MAKSNDRMFVWRELTTTDVDAAIGFYGEVFGWKAQKAPMDGFAYWILSTGDKPIAGAMGIMPGMTGTLPYWGSYVEVLDVDTCCRTAAGLGGKVMNGPHDLQGVGRMAALSDSQGGMFSVMKSSTEPPPRAMPKVGEFCWEALVVPDVAAAAEFYSKVIGWTSMPSPAGADVVLGTGDADGGMAASIGPAPTGTRAQWITYVAVDDLEVTRQRVQRLGGKVLVEREELPKMGALSIVQDPQGATLGLFTSSSR